MRKRAPKPIRLIESEQTEAEQSLDQRSENVRDAWYALVANEINGRNSWANEVYDDHVIVKYGDDYYSVPYSIDADGNVTFDREAATKVERTWTVVEAEDDRSWLVRPITEGESAPEGWEWDVVLIKAGASKNRRIYPEKVLKEAAPLFEGVRVLARADEKHVSGEDKSVEKIVGYIEGVVFKNKALRGRLILTENADWLRKMLLSAWSRGKKDLVGLSIVAAGTGTSVVKDGEQFIEVEAITRVSSTDVVFDPAAGGEFLNLVAAVGEEAPTVNPQVFAALIKGKTPEFVRQLLAEADSSAVTELKEALKGDEFAEARQLIEAAEKLPVPEKVPATVGAGDTQPQGGTQPVNAAEAVQDEPERLTGFMANLAVSQALAETKLPDPVQARIRKQFTKRASNGGFVIDDLSEAIDEELSTWADLEKQNVVPSRGVGRDSTVQVGLSEAQKGKARLDGLFLGEDVEVDGEKIKRYRSLREAYVDLTGDRDVSGQLREAVGGRLQLAESDNRIKMRLHEYEDGEEPTLSEAISTATFGEILGDSIHRRLIREYRQMALDKWRKIAEVGSASDFRQHHVIRYGGYGNLPTVAQGANYPALTSPTDEEAVFSITKKGGLETITRETIINDDLRAVRAIPRRLARAAAHTLNEFVWNFLNNNGLIYDGLALFVAGHANIAVTALSAAELYASRARMFVQTEMDSGKRLGIAPRYLIVPLELQRTAFELLASPRVVGSNNNELNFAQQLNLEPIVVDYWTDPNNWYLAADPAEAEGIFIAFLNGREEPELFTQDMPTVGSMFDADKLTYKVRHEYGGAVTDFRPFTGNIVP